MEQKPRFHVEVHSQTASSPFELKRSPSEVCLGEALEYLLEKPMIGQEATDTQGHRDEKIGELRARDRSFGDTDVFFGDVCAGDHSFGFQNGDFDDEDDDGWEFKAADLKEQGDVEVAGSKAVSNAHARPGIQVDEKWQANTGGSGFSGGFSFDFNPKPVTQHNFFFDPFSKSKQNSAADIPNSTPVNGNMWEFKDAFPETGAKHKLEEARAATPTF